MLAKNSISRIFSVLLIIALMLAIAPHQTVQAAGVRYVKQAASGTGDCTSWGNACTLQTALTGAISGDEIWAAAGTYKPTTGTDRSATFQLINDVALYGGFTGTETMRDQRDPAVNLTIMSGDIDNNDSQMPIITDLTTVTGNATNSYHVVTGSTGATLDGFTITAGNANDFGGGMYNNSSSPSLMNITFSGNTVSGSPSYGGGIYNSASHPALKNVTFSGNSASYGGGMLNYANSNPTLINVTFSNNSAGVRGGGLFNSYSSPNLTNVTFSSNSAGSWGGGMFNGESSPTLTNTTFNGNSAPNGGAIFNYNGANPQVRNSILWGNMASNGGAQIWNESSTASVSDSVVEGGYAGGTNILITDPKLGALGDYGGFSQTIPLLAGSSAMDATSSNCPTTDQRGQPRSNPTCDIGAYEVQTIILAIPGGLTSGLCESWANACELRYALVSAVSGYEIWAAAGTYKPTTGANRSATFQLINDVALYGGFTGTETARDERDPMTNITILSGDIDNNDSQKPIITDLTTVTGNSTNSYNVVTGANNAILDGFTITGGNADSNVCPGTGCGGGMVNISSSPTLTNVNIVGNSTALFGGGMYNVSGSNPTLTNVNFSHNSATGSGGQGGGGMANFSSSPNLTNVTFSSNSTENCGGGMYTYDYSSSPTITNVTFAGNSAGTAGGGVCAQWAYLTIRNTIFWGNTAPSGAQISNQYSILSVSDSVVQGDYTGGTNILITDPKLGALGDYGGFSQTMPLLAGSSAIDTGNDAICPPTDQRGVIRPQGAHCDIGAFEYTGIDYVNVRYAKPIASGTGDCSSWANACTLQEALHGATFGYEIWAAAGTYKPTSGTDRSASFLLKNGVSLYGGFAGTESDRSDRNPVSHPTILSRDIDNNDSQTPIITDLTTVTGNGTNSYHVVTGTPYSTVARLDGVTITAGAANGSGCPGTACGGGMYNLTSSPTVMNVIFTGNTGASGGGMDDESGSNPTLTNVTFSGNAAFSGTGGAISNYASSPVLTNVTISDNSASTCGGGMYTYDYSSHPSFTNVTIAGNSAGTAGGGVCAQWAYLTIRNTIFWGNTAPSGAQISNQYSILSVSDSVVQGDYTGGTNILITDPKLGALGFFGGFTETMPLLAGSSAIDTGNDAICPPTDQRGVIRPQGAHCDIGAFEQDDFTAPAVDTFTVNTPSNSLNIPITALTASDTVGVTGYLITESSTVPAAEAAGWTGIAPATYTVLSDGSYNLYPWAKDAAGNVSAVFASPRPVVVDTTAPTVVSSVRAKPNPTNLSSVNFTITFSEAVMSVDVTDFSLSTTGVSGASVTGVSGSGSVYTVTVNTGSGNGTIRLDIPASPTAGPTIFDLAENPLAGLPYTAGEVYTITNVYMIFLPLIMH